MFDTFGILDFSTPELMIILLIVLLLFGGKKLPELSRSIGKSMKELRGGLSDEPVKQTARKPENNVQG
jgi:sec-independent protein translocase protein TatA